MILTLDMEYKSLVSDRGGGAVGKTVGLAGGMLDDRISAATDLSLENR